MTALSKFPKTSTPTTTVSTKGQVILPKAMRDSLNWAAGTRLLAETTGGGIFLRPVHAIRPTTMAEVAGRLKPSRSLTIEQMDEAVAAEARLRARD